MNSSQKHRQDAMEKCGFPPKSVPLQSESQFCQYEEGDTPPRDEQGESIPDVDVVAPADGDIGEDVGRDPTRESE